MQLVTKVLTLTGSWQQLSQNYPDDYSMEGKAIKKVKRITFQADSANTNAFFIGGLNGSVDDEYGERIPAPVGSIPSAPLIYGEIGPNQPFYDLSMFWLKGTSDEKVRINMVTDP